MENTLENKIRFFSQYWGQEVLFYNVELGQKEGFEICTSYINWKIKTSYLQLTPLEQISDEDAHEAAFYLQRVVGVERALLEANKELVKEVVKNYNKLNILHQLPSGFVDYLRAKGYALPYLELSIKDQISYGWIKLKSLK